MRYVELQLKSNRQNKMATVRWEMGSIGNKPAVEEIHPTLGHMR